VQSGQLAGIAPPDRRTAPVPGGVQLCNFTFAAMVAHALPTANTNPTRAFGRFELRQLLGKSAGTMVWLAFDPTGGHEVMLTMPRVQPPDAAALEHWLRDTRFAARLDHPNIARAAEIGVQDHWPFIAVERALGVTLKEWVAKHPNPPPADVVGWLRDLLQGLAFAHEAGVSHLDLQLHNVLIDERGSVRLMALAGAGDACSAPSPARARTNARCRWTPASCKPSAPWLRAICWRAACCCITCSPARRRSISPTPHSRCCASRRRAAS
jgi:serine/threonine protein kinase